jgi:PTS system N-acetylglucosamine-specific IIC component
VDACTTRLRLTVADGKAVNEVALKGLGARGVFKPAAGSVQVVLGPEADTIADEIRAALGAAAQSAGIAAAVATGALPSSIDRNAWLAALGGAANVRAVEAVAGTRLRIEVSDAGKVDEAALRRLGASGVTAVSGNLLHVVLSEDASGYAAALQGA